MHMTETHLKYHHAVEIDPNKRTLSKSIDAVDKLTRNNVEASLVENPGEHFKTNDGINDNDKQDKEGDAKQGNHRHQDRIDDNL